MTCGECGKEMDSRRETWCEHVTARYEAAQEKWSRELDWLIEANRQSTRLTAADYAVTINCTEPVPASPDAVRRLGTGAVGQVKRAQEK